MSHPTAARAPGGVPVVRRGVCHVLLAYEVAMAIDLDAAQRRVTSMKERATIPHKRRAPRYFDYQPPPLRVVQRGDAVDLGVARTREQIEVVLWDFGAMSVAYAIPMAGSLGELVALSEALYDNAALLADSRRRVAELVAEIAPALDRARLADMVEAYTIFQVEEFAGSVAPGDLVTVWGRQVAQLLRSERAPLSDDEVRDATAHRIAFGTDDVAILDWDGALLVDQEGDDVRAVLEFANVELLEMRWLDQQLDDALGHAYETLTRRRRWELRLPGSARLDMRRIGRLQVDSAVLFEGVNNALKLVGDQYLARVYRLVSERFHLAEWDASILRKLQTLESIYQKISDEAATWRMELLEWIIIILIAVSIVIPYG